LSAFRDADVTARTVRSIVAEAADPLVSEYVDPIVLELESRRDASWGDRGSARPVVAESLASLGDLSRRVDAWSLTGLEWPDLANGIDRTYRRGRRAWRQVELADEDVQPEAFHEARKRTKDLRYQLELFRDAWPPVLSGSAEGAGQLADLSGEMQDLHVTRTTLLSARGVGSTGTRTAPIRCWARSTARRPAGVSMPHGSARWSTPRGRRRSTLGCSATSLG
jgi:CHAD domain-containing protein